MSRQLDGRAAVVTGAGRGIGRATAVAVAREGADVACVARTASQLAQPPTQIGAGLHDRFVAMRDADLLASPAQPARMIADLVTGDTTGQIAGVGTPTTISA